MDEKDQQAKEIETFEVPFKTGEDSDDRVIVFKQPTEGQAAIMARAVRKAERGGKAALEAVALILDVIDALCVDKADRDWLEDGLIAGTVELNDFISVLDGINKQGNADAPHRVKPVSSVARSGRR